MKSTTIAAQFGRRAAGLRPATAGVRLLLALCLLLLAALGAYAKELHPGPRATCAICNARMVARVFAGYNPRTRADKVRIIRQVAPDADPAQVLNVLDRIPALELRNMRVEHSDSFRAYRAEFGGGAGDGHFVVRDRDNRVVYRGNDARAAFRKVDADARGAESAYVLVDDMFSPRSRAFLNDYALYRSARPTTNVRTLATDIFVDGAGRPARWGEPLFAPGATLTSRSEVSRVGDSLYAVKIGFRAQERAASVGVVGRTRAAVTSFADRVAAFLRGNPRASIARALNQSRLRTGEDVACLYEEASHSQFVEATAAPAGERPASRIAGAAGAATPGERRRAAKRTGAAPEAGTAALGGGMARCERRLAWTS